MLTEIIELFHLWTNRKGLSRKEAEHELKALQRFLKSSDKIKTIGTGIFIENKMVAFMANEILHDSYAMIHFDKSDFTIEGITSYVRQVAANVFYDNGCETH